jgi:hypothetical protein
MKFSWLPALALGQDGDSVAMLQRGGLSREQKSTHQPGDLLQGGVIIGSLTDDVVTQQLGQLSAAINAVQTGEGPDMNALMKLFETLSTEIVAFLTQASKDDQRTFHAELQKHNSCISHHNLRIGVAGDVSVTKSALDEAKDKHKGCRKAEKAWQDLKKGYECGYTGTASAALFTVPTCPDICGLKQSFDRDAKSYHDLKPSRTRASCSEEQILYEDKFCEYRAAMSGMCDGLRNCVELIDLQSMKSTMADHADRRREHWSEVEWMGCRLSQMGGDNSTGDNSSVCKKEVNASKYVLTLDVPSPPECLTDTVSVFPQDEDCQAWRQQEYSWQDDAHIKPLKCEAVCQVAESIEVAKGCTDEGCEFYEHHPDACGKYDNPSFNASEACCKCGKAGSTTTTTTLVHVVKPEELNLNSVTVDQDDVIHINQGQFISTAFNLKRPVVVQAEMKATNCECVSMNLFATCGEHSCKNSGYSLESGGWRTLLRIFPGDKRPSVGCNDDKFRVHQINATADDLIFSYDGTVYHTVRDTSLQEGKLWFVGGCAGVMVRNIEIL